MSERGSTVAGGGLANKWLFCRDPCMGIPQLSQPFTEAEVQHMRDRMEEHGLKYRLELKHTTSVQFEINDPVFIYDHKAKNFCMEGTILGLEPSGDGLPPPPPKITGFAFQMGMNVR